ncbi:MAG TPA: hypothetical protein VIM08_01100 [Arthrobacter sp.]|jgi:hypothetical protein
METLKKIVKNQYFPAAAVLVAVVLFWTAGVLGGLSMLNDKNPPIATLTWMLFVYAAAVLTPLAGLMAATDLVRRWLRNRNQALIEPALAEAQQPEPVQAEVTQVEPALAEVTQDARAQHQRPQAKPSRKKAA